MPSHVQNTSQNYAVSLSQQPKVVSLPLQPAYPPSTVHNKLSSSQWLSQQLVLGSALSSPAPRYILSCWAGDGVLSPGRGPYSFPKSKGVAPGEHHWLIVAGKAVGGGGPFCLWVQQWVADSSIMASQCETVQIAS